MVGFAKVRKSFGDRLVLDDLGFAVEKGEIYGLLGPNGSGKSTAINILCNLLDADSGAVTIAGRPACDLSKSLLGVCPQEIVLYRDLRPAENLAFFARLYDLPRARRQRRIDELMDMFGFAPFACNPAGSLSGGWQRRLNIAVALVHSPEVLVLDEPTSAVDIEARHDLWGTIEMLKAEGVTILLTTHHLDEAERLCTRVGIMAGGRVVREGTVAELLALVPAAAVAVVESVRPDEVTARAAVLGWPVRRRAGRIDCFLPRAMSLKEIADALDGLDIASVAVQRVSLEHAYLEAFVH